LLAVRMRTKNTTTWALGETGATGPSGNRYGDAAGHSCIAVAGPTERAITLETGSADRRANMDAFAKRALELLLEAISVKA
jgi:nicotinamide mononucleotide (NMN) deamidase PncC